MYLPTVPRQNNPIKSVQIGLFTRKSIQTDSHWKKNNAFRTSYVRPAPLRNKCRSFTTVEGEAWYTSWINKRINTYLVKPHTLNHIEVSLKSQSRRFLCINLIKIFKNKTSTFNPRFTCTVYVNIFLELHTYACLTCFGKLLWSDVNCEIKISTANAVKVKGSLQTVKIYRVV